VCVNLMAGPLNRESSEANQKGKHDKMKTETEGGGVEVDDDGGEVGEVKDSGGVLEIDGSVLWAQGWWVTCLRLTVACSGSGTRWQCTPRPGLR
jgi:hypothetical protein